MSAIRNRGPQLAPVRHQPRPLDHHVVRLSLAAARIPGRQEVARRPVGMQARGMVVLVLGGEDRLAMKLGRRGLRGTGESRPTSTIAKNLTLMCLYFGDMFPPSFTRTSSKRDLHGVRVYRSQWG